MSYNSIKGVLLTTLVLPLYQAIAQPVVHPEVYDVYVPMVASANEYAASALFLRPGGSNDYAVLVNPFNPNVATPILSPSWEPKGINADFGAGFSLNFRHIFANTGNDINLYWAHLRTSDNKSFPVNRQPPPAQQMTGPFWSIGPDANTTSTAEGQLQSHYDVLNLEVGKRVNLDPDLKVRLFSGLSALWLKEAIHADFSGTDPGVGFYTFGISTKAKFNAGGMRVGANGEYQAWHQLKAVGLVAGNLFIGSQQPSTETIGTSAALTAGGIPVNHQSISHKRFTQLVPSIDAKLGLKYAWEYDCDKTFAVEAGYMASIYMNAIQNYVPSTYVPGSNGIITGSMFLQSLLKSTESFSVDGPYVTFVLKM